MGETLGECREWGWGRIGAAPAEDRDDVVRGLVLVLAVGDRLDVAAVVLVRVSLGPGTARAPAERTDVVDTVRERMLGWRVGLSCAGKAVVFLVVGKGRSAMPLSH